MSVSRLSGVAPFGSRSVWASRGLRRFRLRRASCIVHRASCIVNLNELSILSLY